MFLLLRVIQRFAMWKKKYSLLLSLFRTCLFSLFKKADIIHYIPFNRSVACCHQQVSVFYTFPSPHLQLPQRAIDKKKCLQFSLPTILSGMWGHDVSHRFCTTAADLVAPLAMVWLECVVICEEHITVQIIIDYPFLSCGDRIHLMWLPLNLFNNKRPHRA